MDLEYLQLLLECIPGLICINKEGNVVYANKKMASHWKTTVNDLIGKPIEAVYPYTKMRKNLNLQKDMSIAWYQGREAYGQVEASLHHVLKKDNEIIGLMSYDLFQDVAELEQFIDIYINLDDEIKYLKDELRKFQMTKYTIDNIIGVSPSIMKLKQEIKNIAKTNSTVLIMGETGTGKELVAHSIHNLSSRCFNNFIEVNAASLTEPLAESELFGYTGGSFTGAIKDGKKGKFEMADNGTLFLDEVGYLPASVQPKLLRALQEGEIDVIGSAKSRPIDVRVLSATNISLEELVNKGAFRRDLYYRLDVVEITTPTLRERPEDIPLLVDHIIKKINSRHNTKIISISPEAMNKMIRYDWPGNVRELQNVLERAMNNAEGDIIGAEELDK